MFGFDIGGFVLGTILIGFLVPVVMTVLIIGMVFWSIRRAIPTMPTGKNAAILELRDRFARGEIDRSEFQARMDALSKDA